MTRRETAEQNFLSGYNCAQALILAFSDLLPIDASLALKAASSFGGGMGRLREVCGAVSASFLVLGLISGYDTPETGDVKKEHYAKVQALAKRFEARRGSIVCRTLLGLGEGHSEPTPDPRTPAYYAHRPCAAIVGDAAEILEEFLKEQGLAV